MKWRLTAGKKNIDLEATVHSFFVLYLVVAIAATRYCDRVGAFLWLLSYRVVSVLFV